MSHTLRRSKSKYGRTRRQRQHKKQRHMRGGFSFTDFIGNFKPKTDAEKCQAAKEAAQTACSNAAEGDIEMMPVTPPSSDTSTVSPVSSVGEYGISSKNNNIIPAVTPSATTNFDDVDDVYTPPPPNDFEKVDTQQPELQPQPGIGGARKSKKKNKKRSQSRRKKTKSRKHKK